MKYASRIVCHLALLGAGLFGSGIRVTAAEPIYSGSVRTDYEYRNLGAHEDHDAYGFLYFRGRGLGDGKVDVYTSARLHGDLDGTTASTYDPFGSVNDDTAFRLLQFYVDIHAPDDAIGLRYGRQYVDVADYIQMDGAQLRLFERRTIGGRVFLGQPVSDYTSVNGDLFMGISLVGKPWNGNRSRATYARYQDDSRGAEDDHWFLDVQQRMGDEVRARGYLSVMNGDVRMGGADLLYVSMSDYVFDAVLGLQRWGDYDAGTRAYSPLTDVLGDLEPFTMVHGRVTAEVLPWFYLSPGAMLREPDDTDFTNRRFERYDLSLIFEPAEELSATVALEYWDAEERDRFFSVGGDVRYRHGRLWEVSLGAAYVDYTYLQLADYSELDPLPTTLPLDGTREERTPDAFTYFLRGRWNISEKTALRVSGEIEDDSAEEDLAYRVRTSLEVRL